MNLDQIEIQVLKDVNRYWRNYNFPLACDQLRRTYYHHIKPHGFPSFNHYLEYLQENGKLYVDFTPAGRRIAMPFDAANRLLEQDGTLVEIFIAYDKTRAVKRSRNVEKEM